MPKDDRDGHDGEVRSRFHLALVDDQVAWHETVARWTEDEADLAVSFHLDVADYLASSPADLVCLDYRLVDGSLGTDNVRRLLEAGTTVLLVTSGAPRSELEECVRAGALGVLLKGDGKEAWLATVRALLLGGLGLTREFAAVLLRSPHVPPQDAGARFLQLVAFGVDVDAARERVGWNAAAAHMFLRRLRLALEDAAAESDDDLRALRIGAVDDHAVALDGILAILERHLPEPVICASRSVEELIDAGLPLDVAVLDVVLHDGHTPSDNVRRLVRQGWPVVLFTGVEPSSPAEIDLVCDALDAGAKALVAKGDGGGELATAIAHALRGEVYLNPAWARARSGRREQLAPLTEREREVFALRRLGMTQREIAERLHISAETVKTHVKSIGNKL